MNQSIEIILLKEPQAQSLINRILNSSDASLLHETVDVLRDLSDPQKYGLPSGSIIKDVHGRAKLIQCAKEKLIATFTRDDYSPRTVINNLLRIDLIAYDMRRLPLFNFTPFPELDFVH